MNTQENRTESTIATIFSRTTAAAFLLLFVMGLTFSTTQVESAIGVSAPAVTGQTDLRPFNYFPSQYVNQGKVAEEHIQAF